MYSFTTTYTFISSFYSRFLQQWLCLHGNEDAHIFNGFGVIILKIEYHDTWHRISHIYPAALLLRVWSGACEFGAAVMDSLASIEAVIYLKNLARATLQGCILPVAWYVSLRLYRKKIDKYDHRAANSKVPTLYDYLVGRAHTKLADKVELLAAVLCALPLKAWMSLDQTTGRRRIWHVHPVTVADVWAVQPCKIACGKTRGNTLCGGSTHYNNVSESTKILQRASVSSSQDLRLKCSFGIFKKTTRL